MNQHTIQPPIDLGAVFAQHYERGWSWVVDDPKPGVVQTHTGLPDRVQTARGWLADHPLNTIRASDPVTIARQLAYYEGIRQAVDTASTIKGATP